MKWLFLARAISSPTILPAGTLRLVEDEQFNILRAMYGAGIVLNLTPRPLSWTVRSLFGEGYEMPASTARIVPCPKCMMFDRENRRFVPAKRYTYCPTCDGLQSIVTA